MSERSGRSKRTGTCRQLHRAPSDEGFDLGYISYLCVDYDMKLMYRFAMLRMYEQTCNDGEGRPRRARAARPSCINCLFSSCSVLLLPARRAASTGAGMRAFPVCFLELTGRSQAARLCRASCFSPVIYRRRAARRAIPVRAGRGRPHRRSRRVRSHRSPPPCGRRGRARGRQAPRGDCWASPSPRRGEARARSPIRRDAG